VTVIPVQSQVQSFVTSNLYSFLTLYLVGDSYPWPVPVTVILDQS
jgi:hypothetical protein